MGHTRLYIGDLSPKTSKEQIQALFTEAGKVMAISRVPHATFAFVEMSTAAEAKQAVERYNGYDLDGSRLIVYAVPPHSQARITSS